MAGKEGEGQGGRERSRIAGKLVRTRTNWRKRVSFPHVVFRSKPLSNRPQLRDPTAKILALRSPPNSPARGLPFALNPQRTYAWGCGSAGTPSGPDSKKAKALS